MSRLLYYDDAWAPITAAGTPDSPPCPSTAFPNLSSREGRTTSSNGVRSTAITSGMSHKNRTRQGVCMSSRIHGNICQQNPEAPSLRLVYTTKNIISLAKRVLYHLSFSGVASRRPDLHHKLRPETGTSKPVHGEAGDGGLGQAARGQVPGQRQQAVLPVLVCREQHALVGRQ